jgi:tripartite motif-containing protein 71
MSNNTILDLENKNQENMIYSESNVEDEQQIMPLSLLPDDTIDHVLIPMMDAKVLHLLKCTNSVWKRKIEEYIEKSAPNFAFKIELGSNGDNHGQFNFPFFVASDKQGNIYISDCDNHRIQVFDQNGQWKQCIGSFGSKNGEFNYPKGIVVNSENHIIIVDDSHRMQIFNENMQFIKSFGSLTECNGLLKYPNGIAVDFNDNIIITSIGNHRVQLFDKDGNWKQTIGKKGSGDGEFNSPWDITLCKTDGRIFVSDHWNHRIQVFSSIGKFLFKFGSKGSGNGRFKFPAGIVLSTCGKYLLICDKDNHRIQIFNAMNGSFIKSFGSYGVNRDQFDGPTGIDISPSGQIIISECGNNKQRLRVFE